MSETGPLSTWFYHALVEQGLPAICIDARHVKAALSMATNKTDANDVDFLAQLAEVGFYREVRLKSFDSMLARTRVAAREQLLGAVTQVLNQIRGLMKTVGLVVPKSAGRRSHGHVRRLVASDPELERIIVPLLEAWCALRAQAAALDRQLLALPARAGRARC